MHYSISELEQLTGVTTHNIRIWERRYNALQPARSSGNTRLYDDEQLKKLLDITSLYHAGVKISKACAMGKAEIDRVLQQEAAGTLPQESKYEFYISQIIRNGLEYKESEVNRLILSSFGQNGIVNTYKYILYPLLVRIGLMWRQDSLCPSQEHFLSSIFRQKFFAAIDALPITENEQGGWLLFLPEDEDHDIGLLMANFLLRVAGNRVIYLGPKVPLFAVANTAEAVKPQNLLFFMTRTRPTDEAQAYINQLSADFAQLNIYTSGNQRLISGLTLPGNVHRLQHIHDFEEAVKPANDQAIKY